MNSFIDFLLLLGAPLVVNGLMKIAVHPKRQDEFLRSEHFRNEHHKQLVCGHYKHGPNLDLRDLEGTWLTVYTQPKSVSCFTLNVRSTTDLEREQNELKYGNFSGVVDWTKCLLEVESAYNKHYLQGDGSPGGLLQNIIIAQNERGKYILQQESSDQWMVFGRRGSELLFMRDCSGEAVVVFARAPYWPNPKDLYAILHRRGIQPNSKQKVMCEPIGLSSRNCFASNYYYKGKP